MKPGIHPTWYPDAIVTCACGNTWTTGSTKKEIHTDVCSKCHPFFTGEQRIVDTAGQVERFMKRISAKEQISATQPAPEAKKAKKEKRRERKTGLSPAELPLAAEEPGRAPAARSAPAVEPDVIPEPGTVEVAPVAEVEDFRPEKNAEILPPGEIGPVASIDKIIEVTAAPRQTAEDRAAQERRRARPPRPKAPRPKASAPKPGEAGEKRSEPRAETTPDQPQASTPEPENRPEEKGK